MNPDDVSDVRILEPDRIRYLEAIQKTLDNENLSIELACVLEDLRDHLKFGALPSSERSPCPFCGQTAGDNQEHLTIDGDERFCVECQRCFCGGPMADSPNDAVSFWNERHDGNKVP
jgi:hypothetical protein